ncbi:tRNA 2-thiouridine synthesizing protein A [Nitrosomonas sp. Nm51]|uniref:sulfurtransferase TusA family protein n=1 Tax=Nitrosomonas sp. Nm51 TaxID=133720 RepID=UPI0008CB54BF|nr:sulfurtransferase TusA family protein [Nitrosomonas sp. Nm51]SER24762.1 tRNA 2-thiouridine synthesizing protein A [Nitrosomonas sp. Nm51]
MLQEFDQELDARGLVCPLPILRTKQSLASMSSGQVLKVVATDPAAEIDFQVFSEQTGNKLLSTSEIDMEFVFFLKKK